MAGKKYAAAAAQIDRAKKYSLDDAVALVKKIAYAKFDETVEVTMELGVDPRKADQMVRGTIVLPHGLGKSKRIAVIASGEKQKEAEAAGADIIGGDDLVEKIKGGFLDFDAVIATPDMMRGVGQLGKVLGPRGLMPNPKSGTVTLEVGKAVKEVKAGKVDFKIDKQGIVHASIGKASFTPEKIKDNVAELINAVVKLKPASSKGTYLQSISLSTTMSPGIKIDSNSLGV